MVRPPPPLAPLFLVVLAEESFPRRAHAPKMSAEKPKEESKKDPKKKDKDDEDDLSEEDQAIKVRSLPRLGAPLAPIPAPCGDATTHKYPCPLLHPSHTSLLSVRTVPQEQMELLVQRVVRQRPPRARAPRTARVPPPQPLASLCLLRCVLRARSFPC